MGKYSKECISINEVCCKIFLENYKKKFLHIRIDHFLSKDMLKLITILFLFDKFGFTECSK